MPATVNPQPNFKVKPGLAVRRAGQVRWRDPASGYVRPAISPPGWPSPINLTEIERRGVGEALMRSAEEAARAAG